MTMFTLLAAMMEIYWNFSLPIGSVIKIKFGRICIKNIEFHLKSAKWFRGRRERKKELALPLTSN